MQSGQPLAQSPMFSCACLAIKQKQHSKSAQYAKPEKRAMAQMRVQKWQRLNIAWKWLKVLAGFV